MNDKPTKRESTFFLVVVALTITWILLLAVMQSLGLFGDTVMEIFGG